MEPFFSKNSVNFVKPVFARARHNRHFQERQVMQISGYGLPVLRKIRKFKDICSSIANVAFSKR